MGIIAGVFDSVEAAERAGTALLAAGVAQQRLWVSRSLAGDSLPAEAREQSYEYQTGDRCVLCVEVDSEHELEGAAEVLRHSGARGGVLHVPPE